MKNRVTSFEQSLALQNLGVKQNIEIGDWFFGESKEAALCLKTSNTMYSYQSKTGNLTSTSFKKVSELKTKAFDGGQIDEMLPNLIKNTFLRKSVTIEEALEKVGYYFESMVGERVVYKEVFGWGETHLKAKTNLLIKLLETDSIVIEN
jgi:hypothetical protein